MPHVRAGGRRGFAHARQPLECLECHAGAPERERRAQQWADEDARGAKMYLDAIARADDQEAAALLQEHMSDLSEEHWCAGWLMGCERTLWNAVQEGPFRWGMQDLAQRDVDRLRELHERAGGWWRWSDKAMRALFVPTHEWLAMLDDDARVG